MTRKVGNGLDVMNQRILNVGTATADTDALSRGAGNALYAGIGANSKMLLASSGAVVRAGYKLTPRLGFPVGFAVTVYGFMGGLVLPGVGGFSTWQLIEVTSAGVRTVISTVSFADGGVGVVSNLGTPYAVPATSSLDITCTANTAPTSAPGVAPSFRVNFQNTTLALPTAPATPTGVSATLGTGLNTVNFTLPTSATDAVIWKNGNPLTTAPAGTTSYVDVGGLSTDTYAVSAANLGAISAKSANVTPSSSSFSYWASGVRNLSADTSDWTVTLGSGSGTAATVDGSGVVTYTSGNTGGNSSNDIVKVQWKGPDGASGTLTGLRRKEKITATASCVWEYYFRSNGVAGSTYIQFQFSTTAVRVGGKTGGSFLNWSLTGAANVTCAEANASGHVLYTATIGGTMTAGTQYTVMMEVLPVNTSDNSQTLKVYVDTAANYASPGLISTVILNSTLTALFSSSGGIHWDDILGVQAAGTAFSTLTKRNAVLTPLTSVGS